MCGCWGCGTWKSKIADSLPSESQVLGYTFLSLVLLRSWLTLNPYVLHSGDFSSAVSDLSVAALSARLQRVSQVYAILKGMLSILASSLRLLHYVLRIRCQGGSYPQCCEGPARRFLVL
jgi:hypothetical protein